MSIDSEKEFQVINALNSEHLRDGVRPVMVSMINTDELYNNDLNHVFVDAIENEGIHILYAVHLQRIHKKYNMIHMRNYGHSVIISDVDETDKYSTNYFNCTGVVALGVDKETGNEISFMSHQDPNYFLIDSEAFRSFEIDMRKKLSTLKERSVEGTIDIIIGAGRFIDDDNHEQSQYLKSIQCVGDIIRDVVGINPVVLEPKSSGRGSSNIYINTARRRLFLVQQKTKHNNMSGFGASDITMQIARWKKISRRS